jgi:hypothetical protein
MLPDVPRRVVDRGHDRSVESSVVHPLCIGYVEVVVSEVTVAS